MSEEQTTLKTKKKKAFTIVGIIVLIGLFTGYFYTRYWKTHISTDDAFIEGNVHTISARISGTVQSIHVKDNQPVRKGDLLVQIDPKDYELIRSQAVSALEVEKAKLFEVGAKIESAKANLELSWANLKLSATDKKRAEKLIAQKVISQEEYDRAMTAFQVTQAQVKAAEEQLRQAESQKVTQSLAIKQKEVEAALANLDLEYTNIFAPADGYITKKTVQIGNQIQAGQPLMALVSLKDIWITANYKETEMTNIRSGQKVTFTVDTYPGETFKGKVDSIMAGTGVSFSLFPPENATGNYVKVVQRIPVKIVLEEGTDKAHVLRIGMSVQPVVITQ